MHHNTIKMVGVLLNVFLFILFLVLTVSLASLEPVDARTMSSSVSWSWDDPLGISIPLGHIWEDQRLDLSAPSDTHASAECVDLTARMVSCHLKPGAEIVVHDSSSQYWSRFGWEKVSKQSSQVVYKLSSKKKRSVSEMMAFILLEYLHLLDSTTRYYCTSIQREEELRVAYAKEDSFLVNNITSGIHAWVLKRMYPAIKLKLARQSSLNVTREEQESYPHMVKWWETYGSPNIQFV